MTMFESSVKKFQTSHISATDRNILCIGWQSLKSFVPSHMNSKCSFLSPFSSVLDVAGSTLLTGCQTRRSQRALFFFLVSARKGQAKLSLKGRKGVELKGSLFL